MCFYDLHFLIFTQQPQYFSYVFSQFPIYRFSPILWTDYYVVGLSKILDGELVRRKPVKGSHGEIVGATVMNGDLLGKDIDGIKGVGIVEAFLIFAVAAFDLTVVSGSIGAYELVSNAELSGGVFKKSRNITFGVGKAVGRCGRTRRECPCGHTMLSAFLRSQQRNRWIVQGKQRGNAGG